jgi:Ca2+:H+ antiporter
LLYLVYAGYLWFQLYSHTSLYNDEGDDIAKSTIYSPRTHRFLPRKNKDVEAPGSTSILTATVVAEGESKETSKVRETPEVELETPQMTVWMTICLLAVVTTVSYLLYTR